jgi:hypothetical protein
MRRGRQWSVVTARWRKLVRDFHCTSFFEYLMQQNSQIFFLIFFFSKTLTTTRISSIFLQISERKKTMFFLPSLCFFFAQVGA